MTLFSALLPRDHGVGSDTYIYVILYGVGTMFVYVILRQLGSKDMGGGS